MHKHSGCCDHENVKYCKCCKTVYCADCGKEWKDYAFATGTTWGSPYLTNTNLKDYVFCGNTSSSPISSTCSDNASSFQSVYNHS